MGTSNGLGDFLRARRARIGPADVGLTPAPGLRRTAGLRRQELASLAGLSVDYYVRLEQGRECNPSNTVLEGLAQALRLDTEEHSHLYALANHAAGRNVRTVPARPVVRESVRQLLKSVRPLPAYVLSRTSDILAANSEGLAFFPGLRQWPAAQRNTVAYLFLHSAARDFFADWKSATAGAVAQLRAQHAEDPHAADIDEFVARMIRDSTTFADLWQRHDVRRRRSGTETFHHPDAGTMTVSFEVLRLDHEGQRITIYQAQPGSRDRDALLRLSQLAPLSSDDTPRR
ncbi:helix-turn-helix domain-containing protein [Streptomyces sp. NPDC001083]|uniref:helix-turn-helix domain-containing protein n=1 Tax=Streptomyces sp. NPDC001083 TaxID=3364545 RepID=UPI00368493F6